MMKKPELAIMIGQALAKKGKSSDKSMMEDKSDEDSSSKDDHKEYLKEIAGDIISAIEDKDADALADLLEEVFTCLEASPHYEDDSE